MEGEQHESWGKVYQEQTEIEVEDLHLEEEVLDSHAGTSCLAHLFLHLLKSEHGAVDPSFTLTHETVDCFDGVDLGVRVGHEENIELVFVDTHTENSVLGEIDVLVVEHLLLGVWVDRSEDFPYHLWQENPHEDVRSGEGAGDHFVGRQFLINRLEVFLEKGVSAVLGAERRHAVSGESAGEHMDELEDGLEGFVDEMCEVVLDLLRLLDVEDVDDEAAEAVQVLIFVHFLVFHFFGLQTHVPAHAADSGVSPHVVVHLVDGFGVGSEAHVEQDGVFWFQFVAETVEEPVVGGQLAAVLVFYAEVKIHVFFVATAAVR
jgi:hypothetical protein